MAKRDIIVIGASAGGLQVLRQLLEQLAPDFQGSVFVVWHLSRDYPSQLAQILAQSTFLPVSQAIDGEAIKPGHVYVARPDHHLLVDKGTVRVTRGPMENRFRPSVDVLFRSAALAYGPRVVSVVLSGTLDDGAAGSFAVKELGGVTVVQDPVDAPYFAMPVHTMKAVAVDHILPVAEMGALLTRLAGEEAGKITEAPEQMQIEVDIARGISGIARGSLKLGEPSVYTCPDCHGTLNQITEGPLVRFRCHAGHAYSLDALLATLTQGIEDALWNSIRIMEESALLLLQMGEQVEKHGAPVPTAPYYEHAERTLRQVQKVRDIVVENQTLSQEILNSPEK